MGLELAFARVALAGLRSMRGTIMTGGVGPGHFYEDLHVFAALTGDANPIHLNEDYALATPFKQCIAHGMLSSSFISAVFGTKLPGPGCVYISQTLNCRAPVFIGDHVTA